MSCRFGCDNSLLRGAHIRRLLRHAGDFNDVDTSVRITNLLDASVGLVLFTLVISTMGAARQSTPIRPTALP